jgi:hypothetical protein
MQYPIVVRTRSPDRYVAEPLGISELRVEAATAAEALRLVGRALIEWLGSARLVQIDLPEVGGSNPWLDSFGRSADDPLFDAFQEEMARARDRDEPV